MKEESGKAGIGLGSLALGAVAGVIAGILLAPKAGVDTRHDLTDTLNKVKDDIALKLGELKEFTEQTYHSTVDSVVQTYQDAKTITENQASEIKNDLAKGYDDIKKASDQTV